MRGEGIRKGLKEIVPLTIDASLAPTNLIYIRSSYLLLRIMRKVSVVMGSTSDLDVMKDAINTLKDFGVDVDYGVYSAHRSPERLVE